VSTRVSFVLHVCAAMIISPAVVVAMILTAALLFHHLPAINRAFYAGGVLTPWLWGPGFILGLLVNRIALRRTACWVWLAGIAWMAIGISATLYSYHARFAGICSPLDHVTSSFFSLVGNYCGGGENVMPFTLPTFSAVAYSLGAWISLRFVRRTETSLDRAK
jgi:hypothetical protein